MELTSVQQSIFENLARIGQALSNPHRLRLLGLLAQAERPVEGLASQSKQGVANTSAHLRVLLAANLVEARREGKYVYYRLAGRAVLRFWLALRDLGVQQLPELRELVRAYFDEPESLAKLSEDELLQKVDSGEVFLLDLRLTEEYEAGHLPRAHSLPAGELARKVRQLPRDRPIIAYCRGPYCIAALEACALLKQRGYQVLRLPLGVAEWQAAGRPLERPAG